MKLLSKFLVGGAAALVLAGTAAVAAQKPIVHHLSVLLPGFGTARIAYTGSVAPKVVMLPRGQVWTANLPVFASPFAQMDRVMADMNAIEANMDRRMAATLAQFQQMQRGVNPVLNAKLSNLPPGTQSYSVVTTMVGNRVCTRTTSFTSAGNGAKPQMVSNVSGDCKAIAPAGDGSTIRASTHVALQAPDVKHSI